MTASACAVGKEWQKPSMSGGREIRLSVASDFQGWGVWVSGCLVLSGSWHACRPVLSQVFMFRTSLLSQGSQKHGSAFHAQLRGVKC